MGQEGAHGAASVSTCCQLLMSQRCIQKTQPNRRQHPAPGPLWCTTAPASADSPSRHSLRRPAQQGGCMSARGGAQRAYREHACTTRSVRMRRAQTHHKDAKDPMYLPHYMPAEGELGPISHQTCQNLLPIAHTTADSELGSWGSTGPDRHDMIPSSDASTQAGRHSQRSTRLPPGSRAPRRPPLCKGWEGQW